MKKYSIINILAARKRWIISASMIEYINGGTSSNFQTKWSFWSKYGQLVSNGSDEGKYIIIRIDSNQKINIFRLQCHIILISSEETPLEEKLNHLWLSFKYFIPSWEIVTIGTPCRTGNKWFENRTIKIYEHVFVLKWSNKKDM